MLGVLANSAGVLFGGAVGLAFRGRINQKYTSALMAALALVSLGLGLVCVVGVSDTLCLILCVSIGTLLGELLREVQWPTDITTLDVDAMVVRETTHRFSRLSFHRAMVGRRLPLLLTASGLTWLAFAPDAERDAIVSMLAARPEAEYQLAREPERLAAILARTRQNGYGENFRGWRQEEKIASIAVPVCSQQRVIGCLNLVYIASAMTIEQAAQKHLPALQRVARQIEARMEDEEVWYEKP